MKTKDSTMNDIPGLSELLKLQPVEINSQKIKEKTFDKLGVKAGQSGSSMSRRRWRVMLIAAIIMVVGVPSAYAVSSLVADMREQGIGFFASSESDVSDVNKPLYYKGLQPSVEEYNATVNQSVSFEGGTLTFDTLAVDDNFVNAFFTISYDEPINKEALVSKAIPDWTTLQWLTPHFEFLADGEPFIASLNVSSGKDFENDAYYVDDRTIAVLAHKVIDSPTPDQFELTVSASYGERAASSGTTYGESGAAEGDFTFTISVDKSASAFRTRSVDAGEYLFSAADGSRTLLLDKLSFSPFGVVATIASPEENDESSSPLADYAVTDDKSNTAVIQWRGSSTPGVESETLLDNGFTVYHMDYSSYTYELLGLDPDAQSVTITPIVNDASLEKDELYSANLSIVGTQVPISPIGGYTVADYSVEGRRIAVRLQPYGYVAGNNLVEFMPDDLPYITLSDDRQSSVTTSYYDRENNQLVVIWDYYAATSGELEQITKFDYSYSEGLSLDEASAITLPLKTKNSYF